MDAKKTYSEKLKDPRWQRLRLQVFDRDKWACRWCGDKTSTLNVHHTYYENGREPWEYCPSSLLTLCETCHASEQKRNWIEEKLLEILRKRGISTWRLAYALGIMLSTPTRSTHELLALAFAVDTPEYDMRTKEEAIERQLVSLLRSEESSPERTEGE